MERCTENIDRVNKAIQDPGIEFCTTVKLCDALLEYLFEVWEKFYDFDKKGKMTWQKRLQRICRPKSEEIFW